MPFAPPPPGEFQYIRVTEYEALTARNRELRCDLEASNEALDQEIADRSRVVNERDALQTQCERQSKELRAVYSIVAGLRAAKEGLQLAITTAGTANDEQESNLDALEIANGEQTGAIEDCKYSIACLTAQLQVSEQSALYWQNEWELISPVRMATVAALVR